MHFRRCVVFRLPLDHMMLNRQDVSPLPRSSLQSYTHTRVHTNYRLPKRKQCKKVRSYIAQYPIFRIAQSAFYILLPGIPVLSNTISASLGSIQPGGNFAGTARTQYSPLSIARYSLVQLSELEQCRVKKRFEPGSS